MKFLLIVVSFFMLAACEQEVAQNQDAEFRDAQGNAIYRQDLDKKWLVVNYWATWCGPCIAEIPELNELHRDESASLTMLGVNFDSPQGDQMLAQIQKMKIDFPVFATEPSARLNIPIPQVLPTTYIFAPGGKLVKTLIGPQTKQTILTVIEAKEV